MEELQSPRKQQHCRIRNVSKVAAPMVLPPHPWLSSAASPTHPFVHLESTSTASVSHLAPPSHTSANKAQLLTPESDGSSASPPSDMPMESFSSRRVSLEQHLQHDEASGREEAMQSFILERFLPAAKTIAADHDRPMYSAHKHPTGVIPSTFLPSASTMKPTSVHEKCPSKNVSWSGSLSCNVDGDDASVNAEIRANACGLFCARLAICGHNVTRTSTQFTLRGKSKATQYSSRHVTSSDEEELPSKVLQGAHKQKGVSVFASLPFASSSPAVATMHEPSPRRMRRKKKNFGMGPASNTHTHSNARPLLNVCIKCNTSSSLHQPLMEGLPPCNAISSRQSMQPLRCVCERNAVDVSCFCHKTLQTLGHSSADDRRLHVSNSNFSSQKLSSQVDAKESLACCNISESIMRDVWCFPDDDELEFYDALSRFDPSISTLSNVACLQECKLAKSQNSGVPTQISTSNEHNLAEHLPFVREGEIFAFNEDHEGRVEVPWRDKGSSMVELNYNIDSQHGNFACAQPIKGSSPTLNMSRRKTLHEGKNSSSSSMLGWPLGISSFQSGTRKLQPQGDGCATDTELRFAKMAEEQWAHDGRHLTNSTTLCNHSKTCATNTRDSSYALAPPAPPSRTKDSWLGKALALKASKPSYLSTLQLEEVVVSVQKKVEFTLPSTRKNELRWEDMVKGSHMHPEH